MLLSLQHCSAVNRSSRQALWLRVPLNDKLLQANIISYELGIKGTADASITSRKAQRPEQGIDKDAESKNCCTCACTPALRTQTKNAVRPNMLSLSSTIFQCKCLARCFTKQQGGYITCWKATSSVMRSPCSLPRPPTAFCCLAAISLMSCLV